MNARFRARMATAQSGFHHGTGGLHAVPEDCEMLAVAAVKMALVKFGAIELISSKNGWPKFDPICPSKYPMWHMFQSSSRRGNMNDIWKIIIPMKIT